MSGVVEPIGAVLTVIFAGIAVPLLPYLLSFAAGAMIYVVTEELIPESQNGKHSNIGTIGVAIGFTLMMVLDVALGIKFFNKNRKIFTLQFLTNLSYII